MPVVQEVRPALRGALPTSHANPGFRPIRQELVLVAIDAMAILAPGILATLLFNRASDVRVGIGFSLVFAAAGLFVVFAQACDLYGRTFTAPVEEEIKSVCLVWIFDFLIIVSLALPLGLLAALHAVMLVVFAAGLLLLPATRPLMRYIAVRCSFITAPSERQVVIVTRDNRPAPVSLLQKTGRHVRRTVSLPSAYDDGELLSLAKDIVDYVRCQQVDEILLILPKDDRTTIERILYCLRVVPQPVALIPEAAADLPFALTLDISELTAAPLRRAPLTRSQLTAKRLLDLVAGALALLMVLPVLLAIAAVIRLTSPGAVLFRQSRIGLNGRAFQIFKFRTMKTLDDGPVVRQACRGDERITRVGHVLRRFSLDELPQLFNVLRGEMSLVGPRPHALAHDLEYGHAIDLYAARHNVKPGITGWAQVNGWRGPTPQLELMIRRLEHDLWYMDNWSLWTDIKILLMTVRSVSVDRNAF